MVNGKVDSFQCSLFNANLEQNIQSWIFPDIFWKSCFVFVLVKCWSFKIRRTMFLHKIRRSTDFEALKLWKNSSGRYFLRKSYWSLIGLEGTRHPTDPLTTLELQVPSLDASENIEFADLLILRPLNCKGVSRAVSAAAFSGLNSLLIDSKAFICFTTRPHCWFFKKSASGYFLAFSSVLHSWLE